MLAAAGDAVLAFDARGHGSSSGETNALGWRGADDVAGAIAFLRGSPGVDRQRIAILGLSMGAEEALRAAAAGARLSAVVADGAGASTLGDQRLVSDSPLPVSVGWLSMRATEVLSGVHEPPALASIVGRIRVPVLLIASNARDEYELDRAYQQRIGASASLWHVADAGHTRALERHPAAYENRVTRFLRHSPST
jgi:pimeloyl-ACP methyl ester carboxylesterase